MLRYAAPERAASCRSVGREHPGRAGVATAATAGGSRCVLLDVSTDLSGPSLDVHVRRVGGGSLMSEVPVAFSAFLDSSRDGESHSVLPASKLVAEQAGYVFPGFD